MRNLQDASLTSKVEELLARWQADPSWLVLEVTESMLMADTQRVMENVHRLSDMGVALSIDDFGTGYSSLAYLRRLPVRELKIDRSFVVDMAKDTQGATMVKSIVELAHALDLKVVAEGVETEETLRQLDLYGCDLVQGYLLARPLPLLEVEKWVDEGQLRQFIDRLQPALPGRLPGLSLLAGDPAAN
jgi:EAL domain-containing protein (putative c-di-GMP-specific phosphodiesterase class I)